MNRQSQAVGMFCAFVCCVLRSSTRVLCCTQRVVYAALNACLEVALCRRWLVPSSKAELMRNMPSGTLRAETRRCHAERAEI